MFDHTLKLFFFFQQTIKMSTDDDSQVSSHALAVCTLLMVLASLSADRVGINPKYVALAFAVLFAIFFVSGTHIVLVQLFRLILSHGRGLFSPAGIQAFCVDLQSVAALHQLQVLFLIVTLYLTLQTLCIPGTVALNAAMGALVGTGVGVPLGVILGTIGASLCYSLSAAVGTRLVESVDMKLMKGRGLPKMRAQVHKNRSDLLVYMLFLRLTPVLPNWLVNLASPIVNVPILTFALATFLGIMPQTYLTVRFGSIVVDAKRKLDAGGNGVSSIVTVYDTLFLCAVAVILVVIVKLKKRFAASASAETD